MAAAGNCDAVAQEAAGGEGERSRSLDVRWDEATRLLQRAQFEEAAIAYESFVQAAVGQIGEPEEGSIDARALEGLLRAIEVRVSLGDAQQAEEDAGVLAQQFDDDPAHARLAAAAFFKVGEIGYAEQDWVYAPPGLDVRHLAVSDLGADIERLAASMRTEPTPESPATAVPDAVGRRCTPAEGLRCPRQHIRPVPPPPPPLDGGVVPGGPTMDEHGRYRFYLAPPTFPVR
ncbi:MAG: hypothetical protein HY907_05835 [Deltaproteobacteria bacterium]|nr:hypothetical protein [Deltaproteobacteria bacterium]